MTAVDGSPQAKVAPGSSKLKTNSNKTNEGESSLRTGSSPKVVCYASSININTITLILKTIDQMKANLEKIHKAFAKSDVEKEQEIKEAKAEIEEAKRKLEQLAEEVKQLLSCVSPDQAKRIKQSIAALIQTIGQIVGKIESQTSVMTPEIEKIMQLVKKDLEKIEKSMSSLNQNSTLV